MKKLSFILFLTIGVFNIVCADEIRNPPQIQTSTVESIKPLTQDQFIEKIQKTFIVPIVVGTYVNGSNYFGYVGFRGNLLNQMDNPSKYNYCDFLVKNHAWYFIDQESYQINRIPNYTMPNARDYLKMSDEELKNHVDDLSVHMKSFCASVNMFPVIEFGYYEVNHGALKIGMRNLAQDDESLDDVITWSKKYAEEMKRNHILVTYKHYPFAFNKMWMPDEDDYCKKYVLFSECTSLLTNKGMDKKVLKILDSMPDYAMLMYGNFIYVNPDTKEGKVAIFDPHWRELIDKSNFKGLVISDDMAQIIDLKNIDEQENKKRFLVSWKNVEVLMVLYDYQTVRKFEDWLYEAYKNGQITDDELNNKLNKINNFNTKTTLLDKQEN